MNQKERAHAITKLTQILELASDLMDILLPETDGECPHPPEEIEHEETMDDEPSVYKCTRCGAVQDNPFHSED